MQIRVCLQNAPVEGLEPNVVVAALFRMDGGSDGIRIGERKTSPPANGRGAPRKRHVHLSRLDVEPDEHRIDGVRRSRTSRLQRADQDLRVVHGRDPAACPLCHGPTQALDRLFVVGVVAPEVGDENVCGEDDYRHSRRRSSR